MTRQEVSVKFECWDVNDPYMVVWHQSDDAKSAAEEASVLLIDTTREGLDGPLETIAVVVVDPTNGVERTFDVTVTRTSVAVERGAKA
jgi:hypothetical protein